MKRLFFFLFSYIYTFPLFAFYYLSLKLKKKSALDFAADINRRKETFWELMFYHKVYRNLFYKRFHPWGNLFCLFCPSDKTLTIDGPEMRLGRGVFLMHSFRTIIHAKEIGDNFTIFHNCTIGANVGQRELPIIGDDVTIFTGAVVVGGIKIGDNVRIGANTVVTKDVPSNSTVVGNPAYIIKQNGNKCNIKL